MSPDYIRMKMFIQLAVGFGGVAGWVFWPYWISLRVLTPAMVEMLPSGFWASMDILRKTGQSPAVSKRMTMNLGCIAYFAVGFIVAGLLAWLAWRKAILNVELARWRRKQAEISVKPAEVQGLRSF
jgi:hypothetical protein